MSPERAFPAAPVPLTGGKVLATPFQFYVTGEDKLVLVTWSSVVCTVAFEGRWWSTEGRIEPFRHTFRTDGTTVAQSFAVNVQAGFLLNCAVDVVSGSVAPGQCFAQLLIGRGQGTTFVKLGTVLQGYIGTSKFLGFPGSPLEASLEGRGYYNRQSIASPAAGAAWSIRPGTGKLWRLYSLCGLFTASIAGANRSVYLEFLVNGLALQRRLAPVYAHPPGVASLYTWAPGLTTTTTNAQLANNAPLPDPCWLDATTDVYGQVFTLDVADQWSSLHVQYEEWLLADTAPSFIL